MRHVRSSWSADHQRRHQEKELIGDFKQAERSWSPEPIAVNIHDVLKNRGTVNTGTSADTAAFAVDAIASWWQRQGQAVFPTAKQLPILAAAGGSNWRRARLWKERLQAVWCDRLRLQVTVCHQSDGLFEVDELLMDELLDAKIVDHNPIPGVPPGREGNKSMLRMFHAAFDIAIKLDLLLADGDCVVDRWTASMTHEGEFMGILATGSRSD